MFTNHKHTVCSESGPAQMLRGVDYTDPYRAVTENSKKL